MKLTEIGFNDMVGNCIEFRTDDELRELIELFAKYLKLKKYNYYVSDLTIHIRTAKFYYDITEKRTNKFTIVKEDNFNNRQFNYVELVEM